MASDPWYNIGYGVVAPLVYGFFGYFLAQFKNSKSVTRFKHPMTVLVNNRDIRIHELLAELRIRLGAMRAYVAQFHNGDEFITGAGMRKKSRTHEVAGPGVSYQSELYQGVLISAVPQEMMLVVAEGPSYKVVEEMEAGKFRSMCEAGGIVAVARAAIFMGKNVVAFIGVDFNHERQVKELELVAEYAHRIAPLLGEPKDEWKALLRMKWAASRTVARFRAARHNRRNNCGSGQMSGAV